MFINKSGRGKSGIHRGTSNPGEFFRRFIRRMSLPLKLAKKSLFTELIEMLFTMAGSF
jgi:hypothetical protein